MDQSDISNYAELDFDRSGRCGFPEFIYGAGKTAEQIAGIMRKLEQSEVPVLATRVSGESAAAVCRESRRQNMTNLHGHYASAVSSGRTGGISP